MLRLGEIIGRLQRIRHFAKLFSFAWRIWSCCGAIMINGDGKCNQGLRPNDLGSLPTFWIYN